ncbi:MAG: T9SS type A sorting domain-containing protein [Lewinellaceae bacterium]|nr:T9SS type A sorting domain-containing protein [Saprospiraceae bacterium]MCB9313830.1 T9SS type A sorting domain-containing protein [Lewinellaceae bacterium]HRW74673.1 T9SS type A sorting domain-containing protein [Saprospiraceae bacterium]
MAVPRSVAPEGLTITTNPRFRVYPNPARDASTIHGTGSAAFDEIQILDILGRVLVQRVVDPGKHQVVVPVGELPEGFVILHLNRGGEQVFSELINIQG